MEIKFGIFDHLERREVPLEQLYEERLRLLEAADAANQLGLVFTKQNRATEAKHWFEQAISIRRDHTGAIIPNTYFIDRKSVV